jgi:hypothetical protein
MTSRFVNPMHKRTRLGPACLALQVWPRSSPQEIMRAPQAVEVNAWSSPSSLARRASRSWPSFHCATSGLLSTMGAKLDNFAIGASGRSKRGKKVSAKVG